MIVEVTAKFQFDVPDGTDVSDIFCLDIYPNVDDIRLEMLDGSVTQDAFVMGYETIDIEEVIPTLPEPDLFPETLRDCES